jgi:hypothetical protein
MSPKKLEDYKEGGCHCNCGCENKTNADVVKIYFCPMCKSEKVGYTFGLKNLFGVVPTMKCEKCGFSSRIFPQFVVDKKELEKKNKKIKKVKRKK